MPWHVDSDPSFVVEFRKMETTVQDAILTHAVALRERGPEMGRPRVDTLNGSRHANMKELRFRAALDVWRVAFAFDPQQLGILLVAGNKRGQNQRRFYQRLIKFPDERYDAHLDRLRETRSTP